MLHLVSQFTFFMVSQSFSLSFPELVTFKVMSTVCSFKNRLELSGFLLCFFLKKIESKDTKEIRHI